MQHSSGRKLCAINSQVKTTYCGDLHDFVVDLQQIVNVNVCCVGDGQSRVSRSESCESDLSGVNRVFKSVIGGTYHFHRTTIKEELSGREPILVVVVVRLSELFDELFLVRDYPYFFDGTLLKGSHDCRYIIDGSVYRIGKISFKDNYTWGNLCGCHLVYS